MNEKKSKIGEISSLLSVFVLFLVFFFIAKYLWGIYNIPGPSELIEASKIYFSEYGIVIFFFTSLFESLLFVGNYFPGTLILLFGLATLLDSVERVLSAYVFISLGMMIGYNINYFLGKYGWSVVLKKIGLQHELEKIEENIVKNNLLPLSIIYILPGFGSLLSTAFGVLKFNYFKFLSFTIPLVLFWNAVWGLAMYLFGESIIQLFSGGYISIFLVAIYLMYLYKSGKLTELTNDKK